MLYMLDLPLVFGFLAIDCTTARQDGAKATQEYVALFASSVGGHGKAQRDLDPYRYPLKVGWLMSLV